MTARVVLFIAFVLLTGSILYTGKYKKYFNDSRNLSYKAFAGDQKKKAEMEAARIAAKNNANKEEEVVAAGPDMSDPLVKKGHEIYTGSGQCLKCHGENGEGNAAEEAPLIAGQYDWYVAEQLGYMKAGTRVNDKMMPYLKDLNSSDFEALAAYIKALRVK
jgi:cytochrome c553